MESEACLETLIHLRDHGESEQVRLAASTAILDRGHGRPRQELGLGDGSNLTIIVNRGGKQPMDEGHMIVDGTGEVVED